MFFNTLNVLPGVAKMMLHEPRYRGSLKRHVIKAIVWDGAKTWSDIHEFTGLSQQEKCL
jgi:hypothetical protein